MILQEKVFEFRKAIGYEFFIILLAEGRESRWPALEWHVGMRYRTLHCKELRSQLHCFPVQSARLFRLEAKMVISVTNLCGSAGPADVDLSGNAVC